MLVAKKKKSTVFWVAVTEIAADFESVTETS